LFGRQGTPQDWSHDEGRGVMLSHGFVVAALVEGQERPKTVPLLREKSRSGLMIIGAMTGVAQS
jgi:hypothetical protein